MSRRLDGRVALVTGGGGAIGAACAVRLAQDGAAAVVVADTDAVGAQRAADAVRSAGAVAEVVVADVGDEDGAQATVDAALLRHGRLDVCCTIAGVAGTPAAADELEPASFDHVVRVNLRGVFLVQRAALRAMRATGGAVVNMASSMAGWDVLAGGSAYAASKHGVVGLTRSAALDAARHGIRVNAVCPGVVDTALGVPDPDGGAERFAARIPLRRIGRPEDVAAVVAFLASDDARHVTGACLLVDGGQTLQSWANAPDADAYPADAP